MLFNRLRQGDVSRETKSWQKERDALRRAVESAAQHGKRQRVLNSLERWAERMACCDKQVSK